MYPLYNVNIVCVTQTNLLVKEPVMEKQSTLPPRIQRIEPAQPIKSAAPSSYLQTTTNNQLNDIFLNWLS